MDRDLIATLRIGDDVSFQKVYKKYVFKVYSFVYKYTGQQADTEDIVQNVFIHLWKYRNALNEETNLDAVLFKTAKQEVSKWYKKHKNIVLKDTLSELEHVTDEPYDNKESYDKVLRLINALLKEIPPRRREIFQLHKMEQKSYKEIALEKNMSTSAVANQVSKTLQFLRKELKDYKLSWSMAILFEWFF